MMGPRWPTTMSSCTKDYFLDNAVSTGIENEWKRRKARGDYNNIIYNICYFDTSGHRARF